MSKNKNFGHYKFGHWEFIGYWDLEIGNSHVELSET